ncbi:hypothetical protein THAOC_07649, partial [Thalassiosira oceanica]
ARRDDSRKLLFVPFRRPRRVRAAAAPHDTIEALPAKGQFPTEAAVKFSMKSRFAGLPGPFRGPFRDPRAGGSRMGHLVMPIGHFDLHGASRYRNVDTRFTFGPRIELVPANENPQAGVAGARWHARSSPRHGNRKTPGAIAMFDARKFTPKAKDTDQATGEIDAGALWTGASRRGRDQTRGHNDRGIPRREDSQSVPLGYLRPIGRSTEPYTAIESAKFEARGIKVEAKAS